MNKQTTNKELNKMNRKQAKKRGFNRFKTYEPIKELNTDKCKDIAKSIRNLK